MPTARVKASMKPFTAPSSFSGTVACRCEAVPNSLPTMAAARKKQVGAATQMVGNSHQAQTAKEAPAARRIQLESRL